MGDPVCKFFDGASCHLFATYFSNQKSFLLLPTLVTGGRRRRRRSKPLHINFCSTPTTPNLEVISTLEHSDGSLLFRFGDPSELAKEDELERDSEEEFSVIKVLDGDNERQVIVKSLERPVTVATDAGDSESVGINNTRSDVVERKTGLSENVVEDSKNDDVDVSISSVGMEDHSVAEEILENKDDCDVSVLPPENSSPSLQVEEEMKGQSNEEVDDEKAPLLDSPAPMPRYSASINTNEIEEREEEGSTENDDSTSLTENDAASQVQALDNDKRISENIDPIKEEPAESFHGEINLENTATVVDEFSPQNDDLSIDTQEKSTQVLDMDNHHETQLINTEDQASQDGTFNHSDETIAIEVMPLSAKPILDDTQILESHVGESQFLPNENLPTLSLEAERKEDVENSEIQEVSDPQVVEDKSSEPLDRRHDMHTNLNYPKAYVAQRSEEATAAELVLSSGATLMQYPSKELTGGHEAYFIAFGKWLGVADGVGRWSLEGSDPGVYAHELMQNSESIVSECDKDLVNDPKQVLSMSVSKTVSPGSSTALISYFDGKDFLVANIGDSGFLIIRNDSVYRKSAPMLHEFNLPIQVEKGDDPSQLLEEYKIELDEGDIIVSATDGLFDNLYEQEIVSIVSKSLKADKSPQEIAEIMARRVLEVGSSTSGRSPFADAAQAAGYVGYTGGKRDDVAIIVSVVVQRAIMSNSN